MESAKLFILHSSPALENETQDHCNSVQTGEADVFSLAGAGCPLCIIRLDVHFV